MKLRTVDISKADTRFCNVQWIEKESGKIFGMLRKEDYLTSLSRDQLVAKAAEYYGDINMIHPFREGNGRAQRIFFEHLIVNAGFDITWEGINPERWIKANEATVVCNYAPLADIFENCIGEPLAP
ncbi:putative adenosine monophosphate-protein transferase fic [Marinobacter litoralis]|uniref:protein adenylyltransferase n=1 Tax=Marinobacter litoralis TaxID=187981 RepID=A0A3M2RGP1_9GAMM|nr:putative adenosine monophosphate-protein transferase fic [Marinobacter litoralis]